VILHYCVLTELNDTTFGLTEDGVASDIPDRWASYQTKNDAQRIADAANAEKAWRGFNWTPDAQELP